MNPKFRKFLSFYRPYRGLLAVDMLCATAMTAVAVALPLLVRRITQGVLEAGWAYQDILPTAALMVALVALGMGCSFYVDSQGHAMGAKMEADLRQELFGHLQRLPFSFFDRHATGDLMSRISSDLLNLTELYHHGPEDVILFGLRFLGAVGVLLAISPRLTLVMLAFLPLFAVFAVFFNVKMHAVLAKGKRQLGQVNARVEDSLAGIRTVKAFGAEAHEGEKFAAENRLFRDVRITGYRYEGICYGGITALSQLLTVAVAVFGGLAISGARLGAADLVAFLLYTGYLTEPVLRVVTFTQLYQEGITGFERFWEIIQEAPEGGARAAPLRAAGGAVAEGWLGRGATKQPEPAASRSPSRVLSDGPAGAAAGGALCAEAGFCEAKAAEPAAGTLVFENVGFRYGEGLAQVLSGINLTVCRGETVALVGLSGVGKTTLCALVPRFYEVCEGRILLSGVDIRALPLAALRRQVGVVQQDIHLFDATVEENIRYGGFAATPVQVEAAARKAGAHDFIAALPQGYQTLLGPGGVRLSGGQRQRLGIARVFLMDPPVLILDEATSALDSESERAVQQSLRALAAGRATLVAAHRLSTVRRADRIVVLNEGGIAQQGSHDALLARGGLYARLYAGQG